MKTKLPCVLCAAALMACGKAGTGGSAPPSAAPANQAAAPQPSARADALKIRGFYLGMDMRGVPDAMMEMLAEQQLSDFGFTDRIAIGDGAECVLMYTKTYMQAMEARMRDRYGEARAPGIMDEELRNSCADSSGVMTVQSGADGRVRKIAFNDVKNLFGAQDLPPAEIARKLAGELNLPGLKPNAAQTSWTYTGPDGTLVELAAGEMMGIPMVRLYLSRAGQ
jgi:hypothetical protein